MSPRPQATTGYGPGYAPILQSQDPSIILSGGGGWQPKPTADLCFPRAGFSPAKAAVPPADLRGAPTPTVWRRRLKQQLGDHDVSGICLGGMHAGAAPAGARAVVRAGQDRRSYPPHRGVRPGNVLGTSTLP